MRAQALGIGIGAGSSAILSAMDIMQEKRAHQFAPEGVKNLAQADMIMLLAKRMRFDFYNVTLKREMAKSIDDYLTNNHYCNMKKYQAHHLEILPLQFYSCNFQEVL